MILGYIIQTAELIETYIVVRESRAHNNTERKLGVENASQRVSSQLKSSMTEVGKDEVGMDRTGQGLKWALDLA